uniref:GCN5-related N-acetyltransferase n=1 Tax=Rhodopseudomonas palustris (strain BisA53) TaxID=316055 RepID=Q07JX6_RHOP5
MALDLIDLGRTDDLVLLHSGAALTIRYAGLGDAEALQNYFRALSPRSRYNRLMGPALELPHRLLDRFVHAGEAGAYTLLVTTRRDTGESVIGELRYAVEPETSSVEFGLSVADRWQGQGIGRALIGHVACRAAVHGALLLFGDTLRDNHAMIALARAAGFTFAPTPGDWKQMRFAKPVGLAPNENPCASYRAARGLPSLH